MRKFSVLFIALACSCASAQTATRRQPPHQPSVFLGLTFGEALAAKAECTDDDATATFCWEKSLDKPYLMSHGDVVLRHLPGMDGKDGIGGFNVWGSLLNDKLSRIWIDTDDNTGANMMMHGLTASFGHPDSLTHPHYSNAFGASRFGIVAIWHRRGLTILLDSLGSGNGEGWVVVSSPEWTAKEASEARSRKLGRVF